MFARSCHALLARLATVARRSRRLARRIRLDSNCDLEGPRGDPSDAERRGPLRRTVHRGPTALLPLGSALRVAFPSRFWRSSRCRRRHRGQALSQIAVAPTAHLVHLDGRHDSPGMSHSGIMPLPNALRGASIARRRRGARVGVRFGACRASSRGAPVDRGADLDHRGRAPQALRGAFDDVRWCNESRVHAGGPSLAMAVLLERDLAVVVMPL